MGEKEKQCYFCEEVEKVNCSLYVFKCVDGRRIPVQVPVCEDCKILYETSFPEY